MKIWTIICLVVFVVVSAFFTGQYIFIPKEVIVPIRNEIEQAIKAKSADNVIERSEHIDLEDSLGAVINVPQIVCETAEQFVNLVSKEERIFTALKPRKNKGILKKIYFSFAADKAAEIIYQDEYSYSEKKFVYKVKNYDWQKIVFRKQAEELLKAIIIAGIAIGFLWLLGVMIMAGRWMKNYS